MTNFLMPLSIVGLYLVALSLVFDSHNQFWKSFGVSVVATLNIGTVIICAIAYYATSHWSFALLCVTGAIVCLWVPIARQCIWAMVPRRGSNIWDRIQNIN
jgi:hypothetical protein